MAVELERYEFVAHVYIAATGVPARAGYAWLTGLWLDLSTTFGISHQIGTTGTDLPLRIPTRCGVVSARAAAGSGRQEAVVRRVHDMLCLSVVRAPAPDGPAWDVLDAEWSGVLPAPIPAVVGSVRILQAQLTDSEAPVDAGVLGAVVDGLLPTSGHWAQRGIVRAEVPLGPFAIWEASDPPLADERWERRLVVVAGHGRDAELSAWTWTAGHDLTPLSLYLLQASKIRYELRVRIADTSRDELRRSTDRSIAALFELANQVGIGDEREPDPDALLAASIPLIRLQGSEMGLVDRASRLRDLRRAVEIAVDNMTAHAGNDLTGGLFADDATLANWLLRQLDHDASFLESAAGRARAVTALADQLVTRGLSRRQERVNLGLTGIVGAVLMVLAAIQAFGYQVPLLDSVKASVVPPVVAVLGTSALALSMVVLRVAAPGWRPSKVVLSVAIGALASAVVWLGVAVGCAIAAVPLPPPETVASWGGVVAVLAGAGSWRVLRRG